MFMMRFRLFLCVAAVVCAAAVGMQHLAQGTENFEPDWDSLNARECPRWFRDAKFGIFIHWGVYSVPAYCHTSTYSEWYLWWLKTNSHGGMVREFHERNYGKDFAYSDFAPQFRAELWDPKAWAELFKRAGARYVVLVSKHHDGFALWPNAHAGAVRGHAWNSVDTGPRRDICGELADAVRAAGIKMGFYYSFMEWDNPLYERDKKAYVEEMMIPQIKELVTRYEPAVFWPDGEWNHPDTLWRSPEILAWLYNNCSNPEELVVNDRWGRGLRGQVGDYYTTEYGSMGGGSPGIKDESKPFEECRGIGHSFAFNRLENYDAYQTREGLVRMLADLVSKGGGLLLNLGPTADGRIPVIQQDRLVALGEWLAVNGEAIYGARASRFRFLPFGTSTTKGNTVYLHLFDWPDDHRLTVPGLKTPIEKAYLLHDKARGALAISRNGSGGPVIDLHGFHPFKYASVIALELAGPAEVDSRIGPDGAGRIELRAEYADLHGGVQIESGKLETVGGESGATNEIRHNVGYWSKTSDFVSWNATVEANTRYSVTLDYGSAPGTEGGAFVIHVGGEELAASIEAHTGHWHVYTTVDLGEIRTGAEREVTVAVRCTRIAKTALMNLRQIVLTPVER